MPTTDISTLPLSRLHGALSYLSYFMFRMVSYCYVFLHRLRSRVCP